MDLFVEKLVSRKRSGKDIAVAVGLVFLTVLLVFLILPFFGMLMGLELLIIAALIYGCFRLITRQNIEFEYSLTNNELDIDKIFNRRRRKRLVTVNARQIEVFAPVSSEKYAREATSSTITRTYDCSAGKKDSGTYFTVFFDNSGQKCLLIFEPNEKMIEGFRRYSPRKIFDS